MFVICDDDDVADGDNLPMEERTDVSTLRQHRVKKSMVVGVVVVVVVVLLRVMPILRGAGTKMTIRATMTT